MGLTVMSAGVVRAGSITAPSLINFDTDYYISGIDFTVLVSSTLTSFTFENQGQADTVDLVNPSGAILDSVSIPASTPSDTVTVDWSLTAGDRYYLLQTAYNNGLFANWGHAAPSDAQIALIDTGDFNLANSLDCATFGIGGQNGYNGDAYWADFTNLTTIPVGGSNLTAISTPASPEPASVILVLPFLVLILWRARLRAHC